MYARALLTVVLLGCAGRDDAPPAVDEGPAIACYGSKDPAATLIDPDAPTYSDADNPLDDVRARFSKARATNAAAYRAYAAAKKNADVLGCGFCKCGCARSLGHESALDCFKDMHGFT